MHENLIISNSIPTKESQETLRAFDITYSLEDKYFPKYLHYVLKYTLFANIPNLIFIFLVTALLIITILKSKVF